MVTSNTNPNYDPNNLLAVPSQILGYKYVGVTEVKTDTGQASSATIQAGGSATVIVAGKVNNTDVKESASKPTHTSRTAETAANGKELQTVAPGHIGAVPDSIETINALNGAPTKS
ncbi:hypothetical protein [Candidatus Vondammii sp. HM_W22]|uniref:hypothetical protein n=1 Tax=Candidatus Vondammii sp. HM_W22 TaxID=2687299 RepID=UPI001F12B684|nr:hypothetical protein [Candidatus Vondammii sp. HM_W22]